jgi:hypothetical protein
VLETRVEQISALNRLAGGIRLTPPPAFADAYICVLRTSLVVPVSHAWNLQEVKAPVQEKGLQQLKATADGAWLEFTRAIVGVQSQTGRTISVLTGF